MGKSNYLESIMFTFWCSKETAKSFLPVNENKWQKDSKKKA
jgi:hypothetical protein